MRVSTAQIYDTGINGISRNQAGMLRTQTQITTGRRVLAPSDDPVASAQALLVTQSQQVNQRYVENQGRAEDSLAFLENTLGSVSDLMQNVLERTVQAGNGSLGSAERKIIARELRMRYDELTALANTQDGEGNYIFAGFRTSSQPFPASSVGNAATGSPVPGVVMPGVAVPPGAGVYAGDDGRRELQVEASRVMTVSEPGSDVFIRIRDKNGDVTGESAFTSLGDLITALEASPFDSATYQDSLSNLYAALDNTQRIRTTVGTRLAELESLQNTAADRDLQFQATLSDLQDLDYAEAISTLSKQQIILEAAQKSFMTITGLGLFNQL